MFEDSIQKTFSMNREREALTKHVGSAKKECPTLFQDLEAEKVKAIRRIEEPETFKIGEDDLDPKIVIKLKSSIPK